MTSELYLGVDIGGTKVRVGLVDEAGSANLLAEASTRAEPAAGVRADDRADDRAEVRADPGMRASLALAQQVARQAADLGLAIAGVGIGVPEYVHRDLLRSDVVIAWTTQPAELFADIAPVTVESDVRCGALAEARLGAGRDCGSMLYVSVGTGISSTIVIDGVVWPGHRGEALALGELPIERTLDTGGATNLEQFASGTAIAGSYLRATGQQLDGAREVLARAEGRDPQARAIVQAASQALGRALAWAVDIIDPEVIVLGGGLGASGGWWLEQVRASYLPRCRPEAPAIVPAALGADSGVVGAAIAARSRH